MNRNLNKLLVVGGLVFLSNCAPGKSQIPKVVESEFKSYQYCSVQSTERIYLNDMQYWKVVCKDEKVVLLDQFVHVNDLVTYAPYKVEGDTETVIGVIKYVDIDAEP
jgi:hypothetical protein